MKTKVFEPARLIGGCAASGEFVVGSFKTFLDRFRSEMKNYFLWIKLSLTKIGWKKTRKLPPIQCKFPIKFP